MAEPGPTHKTDERELTPAERKLAEEGGPIAPGLPERESLDFKDGAPTIQKNGPPIPASSPAIDASRGVLSAGTNAPPGYKAQKKSPEQIAFEASLGYSINYELWVFNSCLMSVKNMVREVLSTEPPDAAEFGQFSAGKRTPLEIAEPYIAIEVYRQVRRQLREEEERETPGLLRRVWRAVFGTRHEEEAEEEAEPTRPPEQEEEKAEHRAETE